MSSPKKKKPNAGHVDQVGKWMLSGCSAGDIREAIKTNFPEADAADCSCRCRAISRGCKPEPATDGLVFRSARPLPPHG